MAPTETAVKIVTLPPSYLPGNLLPKDTMCYTPGDEHNARCSIHYVDHDVYFNYDAETKIISRTIMPARDYTLGMLIAAWGSPSGNTVDKYTLYVYWNTRSALLYTTSIQPDSRVDFILYDLEPQPSSTWRGFRSTKEHR